MTRNQFYFSENALTLTYGNVQFQKNFGGEPRTPIWGREGREGNGKGKRKEGEGKSKGRDGRKMDKHVEERGEENGRGGRGRG